MAARARWGTLLAALTGMLALSTAWALSHSTFPDRIDIQVRAY